MPSLARRRIAVTGGCGALGTCLTRLLSSSGCREIVAFDRVPPSFQAEGLRYVSGDILDADDLDRGLTGCEVVFHLAALADPTASSTGPMRYVEVNVLGTARVLEACRRLGVAQVVYTSTGHVYGVPLRLPVDEEHRVEPRSIYAASKLAGEVVARGYGRSFGGAVVIARLSNLYGGLLGANTVLGRAIHCVLSEASIQLRSMEEVRDFLYIEDAAEALVRLAASGATQSGVHTVNVATGCGIAISDAIRELIQVAENCGLSRPPVMAPNGQPDHEVPVFVLDNHRLRELTGWVPMTSLHRGLADTLGRQIKKHG
jgi:nucleoside-diphosphate-sugar epimerase